MIRPAHLPVGWGVVAPSQNSEKTKLQDYWKETVKRRLIDDGVASETIRNYNTQCNHWLAFWRAVHEQRQKDEVDEKTNAIDQKPVDTGSTGQLSRRREEPSIGAITAQDMADFRAWFASQPYQGKTRAKSTINRAVKFVRMVLKAAEDNERIASAPRLKKLAAPKMKKKIYLSIEHVDKIYRACSAALWPTWDCNRNELSISPADYWRAIVVMLYNYGFRTNDLVQTESAENPAICWKNIVFEPESPGSEVTNQHGWLYFVPAKTQRIKPDPLVLPLSRAAKIHLERIKPTDCNPSDPVFPFPRNKKRFYATWDLISTASGVGPKLAISQGREIYKIYDMRKTCATHHNRNDRGIAPFILGHSDRDDKGVQMTDTFYDNPEEALVDAFKTLQQPESFYDLS